MFFGSMVLVKSLFSILLFSLPYSQVLGQVLIEKEFNDDIELEIVGAGLEDSYEVPLQNYNYQTMGLVCKEKDFLTIPESYIRYYNVYGEFGGKFKMNDQLCWRLKDFFRSTRSIIDAQNPVYILLSRYKKQVKKVILPPVDPYAQEDPRFDLPYYRKNRKKKAIQEAQPEKQRKQEFDLI